VRYVWTEQNSSWILGKSNATYCTLYINKNVEVTFHQETVGTSRDWEREPMGTFESEILNAKAKAGWRSQYVTLDLAFGQKSKLRSCITAYSEYYLVCPPNNGHFLR